MLQIVFALLALLIGLKFIASPLLSSILEMRVDGLDYKILPSLGALVFITIVMVAKVRADAETRRQRQADHDEQGRQRPLTDAPRTDARNYWRRVP